MYYFQIEKGYGNNKEIVAIGKRSDNERSLRTQLGVTVRMITQSEYETYQAFDLYPEHEEPRRNPDKFPNYINWGLY